LTLPRGAPKLAARMRALTTSTAAALVLLALACARGEQPLAPRANVLVIVIDTLRADRLGAWGAQRPTSPRLDALAAESLLVERAIAQSPWTKPSLASLFTSLHPSQHGAVEETTANHLAPSLVTLAECFAAAGYRTGAVSENPHVSSVTRFDQGFERMQTLNGFRGDRAWVVQSARRWLEERDAQDAERPFFLYVHFLDPHGPYEPGPPWRERFLEGRASEQPLVREGKVGPLAEGTRALVELAQSDVEYLRALYDAEIRETDAALESLLAELESRALLEDTLVLLTSDHGEEFLEHGTFKHGYQLYEESLRVPLVLRVPGLGARRERDAAVQHIDLAPTLLELVGLPVPPAFQGRSLVPLLRGEPLAQTAIVSETSWRGIDLASAQRGPWKLIVDRASGARTLFDLDADPGELQPLDPDAAQHATVVAELQAALERAARRPADVALEGATGEGDATSEEALRALGYFGK
jgi:arylsulfatase A-like enzyme